MVAKTVFCGPDENGDFTKFITCVCMCGWDDSYDVYDDFIDGKIACDVLPRIREVFNTLDNIVPATCLEEDYAFYLYAWDKVLNTAENYPYARISLV